MVSRRFGSMTRMHRPQRKEYIHRFSLDICGILQGVRGASGAEKNYLEAGVYVILESWLDADNGRLSIVCL